MWRKKLLATLLLFCAFDSVVSARSNFVKISDGAIVYLATNLMVNTNAVRLLVVSDNIIRAAALPLKDFPTIKSLMAVYKKKPVGSGVLLLQENR